MGGDGASPDRSREPLELANADIDTMNGIIPGRRLLRLSARATPCHLTLCGRMGHANGASWTKQFRLPLRHFLTPVSNIIAG